MKKIFSFALFIVLCSACATVIDGNKQQLAFDSNEKDVEIYIDDKLACHTPCLTEVDRANKKLMIVAKKDGFQDRTLFLDKSINPTSAFNVICLWSSTFGLSTDLSSADVWEYQPNSIYVVMTKEPKSALEKRKLQKQNEVRDFVLKNFDGLQNDTFDEQGTGEYIKTLSGMTDIPVSEIKSVLQTTFIATDCAERIVGLTLSK